MGSNPDCQSITLQTIDAKNNVSKETQFVATLDIQSMTACSFPDKKNPLTGEKCREAFSNINASEFKSSKMPEELITKVYFSALGVFGFYILLKLLQSKRK